MLRLKSSRAFSLLEVVMSLAIFSIIMSGTMLILGRGTQSYRNLRVMQTNLENAQYALNIFAKELRTSSVLTSSSGATTSWIKLFDYSQGRCIQYQADETSGNFSKRSHIFNNANPDTNRSDCLSYSFTESYEPILTGLSAQALFVDPSTAMPTPQVGRV
ncbi:MAG: type II secretion system protein J, partial [Undibacterium sp.]